MVDASFAVALVTSEREIGEPTLGRLASALLVAPTLWRFEVANTLMMLARRKRFSAAEADRMLAELATLQISEKMAGADRVWTATLALARLHKLTVYDAAYLELAIRLDAPLATYDNALIAAARSEAVEVVQ